MLTNTIDEDWLEHNRC